MLSEQGLIVITTVTLAFIAFVIDRSPSNPFVQIGIAVVSYYWGKSSQKNEK